MPRLRLLAVICLLPAALAFPVTASASCSVPVDPAKALAAAPIVFVGTVRTIGDYNPAAVMTVDEIWKGTNLPTTVTEYGSGPSDAPALSGWVEGERYLVFPITDANGDLHEAECSPTSVYQPAFDKLRPANAHPPQGPPTSGVPGSTPIAAIFLAILVLGSLGGFLLFRSGGSRAA